jgi:hypothetical protein
MGGSSGGGGGGSAPAIQTQIVREAPGIEERKIGLMDIGLNLGSTPVNIPDYQIAGRRTRNCTYNKQGIRAAGTTGVGAGTQQAGIASLQQAAGGPNINQFFNPYQSYVLTKLIDKLLNKEIKLLPVLFNQEHLVVDEKVFN